MTALQGRCGSAALLLAGALALCAGRPTAQELQAGKPIRLIVGLSPGGGTDVTARLIAQQMTPEHRHDGAGREQGRRQLHPRAEGSGPRRPDGHTLYFISTSSLITQALHPDYPFDLLKFTPVSEVATGPLILVVRNDLGVKSVKELIALAKQKPGTIKFGARRRHRQLARRRHRAAARPWPTSRSTSCPIAAPAPALNDLLGGHIDAMFDAMPVMSVQAKEGKVTPLAVTGTKRSAALPDVPTMQESGFPTFVVTGWYGILAPARHAAVHRPEAARRGREGDRDRRTWSRRSPSRAWSRAARSRPNTRSTWSRSSRSIPRSSRTRTSSRRNRSAAPSRHGRACPDHPRLLDCERPWMPGTTRRACPLLQCHRHSKE